MLALLFPPEIKALNNILSEKHLPSKVACHRDIFLSRQCQFRQVTLEGGGPSSQRYIDKNKLQLSILWSRVPQIGGTIINDRKYSLMTSPN